MRTYDLYSTETGHHFGAYSAKNEEAAIDGLQADVESTGAKFDRKLVEAMEATPCSVSDCAHSECREIDRPSRDLWRRLGRQAQKHLPKWAGYLNSRGEHSA
jgi:hypothetical protein